MRPSRLKLPFRHEDPVIPSCASMFCPSLPSLPSLSSAATSTTWVMSMACMTEGCAQVKLFVGAVIPFIPPLFAKIDILERGLMQSGTMQGPYGHSLAMFAGQFSLGIPVGMGITDQGTLGEMSYNHTGALGFAYWEESMPNMLTVSKGTCAGCLPRFLHYYVLCTPESHRTHELFLRCRLVRVPCCRSGTPLWPCWTSCAAATCSTPSL